MSSWNERTTSEEITSTYADSIRGKNVVITGVRPSSVGLATVNALAPYAKTIVIATRTVAKAEEGVEETKKINPNVDVRIVPLDLLSGPSIRKAAEKILEFNIPIHVLINNAVIIPGALQHTEEGFESQMAGDHLGHFLFTSLLFPSLLQTDQPRIINLSSIVALEGGAPRWDDMHYKERPEEYETYAAYAQVKTAVSLFSVGLAEKYGKNGKGVLSYSVHPGGILETNVAQSVPKQAFIERGIMDEQGNPLIYFKTLSAGAATSLYAAFAPDIVDKNGAYLSDCAVVPEVPDYITSSENAQRMWTVSEEAWGIKFGSAA